MQFPRARHNFKRRRRWMGVKGAAHVMGAAIPNILQPGAFVWLEKNTGTPTEGATCAWMAADEVVGLKRAFLAMLRSSPRLICRVLSLVFV
ncbi:hypothetical protein TNCV_4490761 [Trichonephila clavipes]|nr:hypothetical protein TNCV_4490761 [Trichonephila clavipes]